MFFQIYNIEHLLPWQDLSAVLWQALMEIMYWCLLYLLSYTLHTADTAVTFVFIETLIPLCPAKCWMGFILLAHTVRLCVSSSGGCWHGLSLTVRESAIWEAARTDKHLNEQWDAVAKPTSLWSPQCATPPWVGSVAFVCNEDWWRRE